MSLNHPKRVTSGERPRAIRTPSPRRESQSVTERERARLARELHDQLGPILSLARLNVEAVQRAAAEAGNGHFVVEGLALLDRAIEKVRTLSFDVHPAVLDELGLSLAIASYAERLAKAAGLVVNSTIEPVDALVPLSVATACYRVFEEAGTNVVRHARARNLGVRLRATSDMLELRIRDDGRGFDPAVLSRATPARRLGVENMRQRVEEVGGEFSIESAPGRGTDVRVRFSFRPGRRANLAAREARPDPTSR
ncbi:MAG TPA: sensor histidine kinase [Gemmatimonadales bacterium]|nr:sensor histidine kinase [Gemmatimonadales bacterium]